MLAQFSEAGFWWWTGKRFVPKLVKKTHDFFFVTTVRTYVYDIMAIYILCLREMNSFFWTQYDCYEEMGGNETKEGR